MYQSSNIFLIDIALLTLPLILLGALFSKPVRKSAFWNATVTPLASIIGSGFLVVAPLLWILAGYDAVWVLLVVLTVAYAIGSVIRYNIKYVEPFLSQEKEGKTFKILNVSSHLTLGLSYFISVTFYVRILSAFALKLFDLEDPFLSNSLTTVILLFIGIVGYFRGFDHLEFLELVSVNSKMSVIFIFILALFLYDWLEIDFHYSSQYHDPEFSWLTIRKIFGILLVVQGFEISRYLGHKYDADLRIRTMRFAQIISSIIYLSFTFLVLFLMKENQQVTETAIIDVSRKISVLLPVVIVAGAIFSQFSAAIADTVGCGGVISEFTNNRISGGTAYLAIACGCILLVWIADVFKIITYASRMFGSYYLIQCLMALYINRVFRFRSQKWSLYFAFVGLIAGMVFCFGVPAE